MREINLATTISEICKAPNLGTPRSCYRREKNLIRQICGSLQTKLVLCIGDDLFCIYDIGLQLLNTETFKSVVDVDLYDGVRKFILKKHHSEACCASTCSLKHSTAIFKNIINCRCNIITYGRENCSPHHCSPENQMPFS